MLVGACIAGPPAVRGNIFWASRHGKGGRSKAPPLRRNYKISLKFISTLSRHIVGVGLCSTRGALWQHRALAGEQCSPLRWNFERAIEFLHRPCLLLVGACIAGPPAVRGNIFWASGCGKGGRSKAPPLRSNHKISLKINTKTPRPGCLFAGGPAGVHNGLWWGY